VALPTIESSYFPNGTEQLTSTCTPGGGNAFGWLLTLVSNTAAGLPSSIPTGTIVLSTTQP
jgi:hypothetical protein